VEVVGEIGIIEEWRKIFSVHQISYCYRAQVKGSKGTPHFTDEEAENGFEVVWLPYQEALETLTSSMPSDDEGSLYIVPRDTILLKASDF